MTKAYFFIALLTGAAAYAAFRYLWVKVKAQEPVSANRQQALLLAAPVLTGISGYSFSQFYLGAFGE